MTDDRPDEAKRLQYAREKRGFASAKDACAYFGWNYSSYSQHERGERGLSRAAAKYAAAYRVSEGWLLTGEGKGPDGEVIAPPVTGYRVEPNAIFEGPAVLPPRAGPRDIEERGVTVGGFGNDESAFELNGQVIDMVTRPPGIANRKGVFALRVANESMIPKYEDGERVYVEPRKAAIGEYVVVELYPTEEGAAGKSYIKRLVSQHSGGIRVEQFNPKGFLEFDRAEIRQVLRVIPTSELLGI